MSSVGHAPVLVSGPWFEEFERGQVFDDAPGLTLTAGHAAMHHALTGDRLRLALDAALCREVTGRDGLLAHANLVCDVAIGQSTGPSQRVRGNLFERGVVLARPVFAGETLRTRTEAVGAQAEPPPGRRSRDGPCRATDPDDRRARRPGARLLALRDDPAARPCSGDRARVRSR